MEKCDIVIIGAGIIGLSVAAKLSSSKRSIYVLERHDSFGRETSSRNSEVVHAGIYYPPGSLKAKLCVEGKNKLYEICRKNNIAYQKIEKLIVAINSNEEADLENLLKRGKNNGVEDLKIISEKEAKKIEPNINCRLALYSSSTGIIDSHNVMKYFEYQSKQNGADVAYNCKVTGLIKNSRGYEIAVRDSSGEDFIFNSRSVINCAGLESDSIAKMAGIDIEKQNYSLKYCKGQYFRVTNPRKCALVKRLIYPVPHEKAAGLGVHLTKDLSGGLRLGPDACYVDRNDFNYDVDALKSKNFLSSSLKLLPFLKEEDLMPDIAGVRPKLQGEGEDFRDFIIKEESELGFPGLINLIGIESPGLTASMAIAEYVSDITKRLF